MVDIEYNNVKVSVPENWDDITLGFYETFYTEKPQTARDRVAYIAKVCNTDVDILREWPAEVFNIIVDRIDFLFKNNPAQSSPEITIDKVKYVVPIEAELTLGEWVDIDEVQKKGENVLSNTLAIVCRPPGEDYSYRNNEARTALFAAQSVSSVLGVLAFFALQNGIRTTYSNLYEAGTNGRPIAPEYKTFSKSWGWYKIIADLADTKILCFDRITSLPVTEVFTFLQYKKDKEYAEEAQRKLDRFIAKNKRNADS